jgi:2-oxoglutarate/2-oxoacid ferredoxin oxidoreductase subunit beta
MTIELGLPTVGGLSLVPVADEPQKAKDFKSDQEVRWCPGCGDYVVLNAMQSFLPTLGLKRENIVFISGIGCSSRFPYYMNTYGMHSIHGRAPAIATGLAITRPDLSIWVITGDGDALSIGGNHLIHALRRNINLKILLFNNRIYGLTKGQYSPTSEPGKITKSTPTGSLDHPFNPLSLALGAEATFIARTLDNDRTQLTNILTAAAHHRGSALIEIYQNCPIFNDGAFDTLKEPNQRQQHLIPLHHNKPILFGTNGEHAVIRTNHGLNTAPVSEVDQSQIVTHDTTINDPTYAFALSQLSTQNLEHVATGIYRNIDRPTYDDQARRQVELAVEARRPNLQALLNGNDTWTVG